MNKNWRADPDELEVSNFIYYRRCFYEWTIFPRLPEIFVFNLKAF